MKVKYSLPASVGAAIAIGVFSQTADAVQAKDFSFDTTHDLYDVCATNPDDANYVTASLACRAFIEATVQYHDEVTNRKNLKPLICYPKGTTIDDGKAAFLAWAQKHGSNKRLMAEQPVVGLVRSLASKYPCKL